MNYQKELNDLKTETDNLETEIMDLKLLKDDLHEKIDNVEPEAEIDDLKVIFNDLKTKVGYLWETETSYSDGSETGHLMNRAEVLWNEWLEDIDTIPDEVGFETDDLRVRLGFLETEIGYLWVTELEDLRLTIEALENEQSVDLQIKAIQGAIFWHELRKRNCNSLEKKLAVLLKNE